MEIKNNFFQCPAAKWLLQVVNYGTENKMMIPSNFYAEVHNDLNVSLKHTTGISKVQIRKG